MAKQKIHTSESGKKYTFQFPGIRAIQQMRDRVKNKHGIPQDEKVSDEVLKYVVVDPKMKMEDFGDDMAEFQDVVQAAVRFINGMDDPDPEDEESGTGDQ